MKKLLRVVLVLLVATLASASTIVGVWSFDMDATSQGDKSYIPVFKSMGLDKMKLTFSADGKYTLTNKGGGTWKKKGKVFEMKAEAGKVMTAKLLKNGSLEVIQPSKGGDFHMFYRKK